MGGGANVDVAVCGAQSLVRGRNPVGRTQRPRNLSLGEIQGRLPDGISYTRFQERGVHRLSLSGFEGVDVGAQDTVGGQSSGGNVGDRYAHLGRRAVGKAGNAHQSTHSLGHQVKSSPIAVWTGTAETGYRAIYQGRPVLDQLGVTQAQPFHDTGTKVLHHNIRRFQQPPEHLASSIILKIQGQTAFVAV